MDYTNLRQIISKYMYIGLGLTASLCLLVWLLQTDDYQIGLFVTVVPFIILPTWFLVLIDSFLTIKGSGFKKAFKAIFSFIFVTIMSIIILIWLYINTMATLDEVSLPNRAKIRLVQDHVLTDVVFSLWEEKAIGWERLPVGLTYAESNEFTENPSLEFSFDKEYLLVRRGGIWTDCIKVTSMTECDAVGQHPYWDDEQGWIDRSKIIAEIAAITPK